MNPQAKALNDIIISENSTVYNLLSEKGKNIFFPKKGILGQTADAKNTKINATIGAAVEDDGSPMRLASIEDKINLDPSKVFPYAPSFGRPDLRAKWKEMMVEKNPSLNGRILSTPIVTNALTHGMSMVAYLFADEGDELIVPNYFWGNYNLIVVNGYNAQIGTFNLFKDNKFDIAAFKNKLTEGEVGKRMVVLNFPNNPSGYTPSFAETEEIKQAILDSAEAGNQILAIADDAYFGLVYEDGISQESIFTELSDLHENVLAVKVDGPTKEDYVWGFRVGFITYGIKGGSQALYECLEAKTAGAVRGNISNAANISQSLLLAAFESEEYQQQKDEKYELLKERYCEVKAVLKDDKYNKYFKALPYNSGYFMCVKLAENLDGEAVRKLLIEKYSIGTINLNNVIRIAYAAVAKDSILELFEGLYGACKELTE